jgi:poly-beta-1,6-N-acetyl-D-glucosamine synthase
MLAQLAWWGFVVCLAYLLVLAGLFAVTMAVAARENRRRAREAHLEDFDTLRSSPFTIPVSIIAPAFNEEVCVTQSVHSLLALDYPDLEVIVVNDGSTDRTLEKLTQEFDLEPAGTFYRETLPSAPVRQIYRSRHDQRLLVVDKTNGGKADALNCGLNLARYRYVCCVDGDTVYYRDALLKGMRLAMQDPATIVGITSQVDVSGQPERAVGPDGHLRLDRTPLVMFQVFDYIRAFVATRLAWSRWNYMLCSVGAFSLWRRDVVLELGGFSTAFTCEDIELTFRVHEHYRTRNERYQVVSLAESVGVTEGPTSATRLVSQRERWQRVIMETVWHYRHMLLNPRYGTVGWLGMPYYVLGEVLAPIFQVLALLLIPVAIVGGLMAWGDFARIILTVALACGAFTAGAIFMQDRHLRSFRARDLTYMLLLAPCDLFLYRPVIIYAQFKGLVGFLTGDRSWNRFARNERA